MFPNYSPAIPKAGRMFRSTLIMNISNLNFMQQASRFSLRFVDRFWVTCSVLIALNVSSFALTNLVVNGSFESSLSPSWLAHSSTAATSSTPFRRATPDKLDRKNWPRYRTPARD